MNKKESIIRLLFSVVVLFLLSSCGSHGVRIALVCDGTEEGLLERDSIASLLTGQEGDFSFAQVDISDLTTGRENLEDYDVVWFHRPDSSLISEEEKAIQEQVTEYVLEGGRLMLSRDAVRLLNSWQLEEQAIEVSYRELKDEGFGRKIGFHAYRSHPLFEKMFGGAYIWHGKEDNKARTLGFLGDNMPKADGAKIIGVDWAYITYHKQRKLVWEMPVGKGKILAVGAYMYFSKPNFHKKELVCFTENCLNYLRESKCKCNSKAYYWNYEAAEVKSTELQVKLEAPDASEKWDIPVQPLTIRRKATGNYYDLPGRRVLLQGKEKGGIDEIWTHPFMSLRDFSVQVDTGDGENESLIELCRQQPEVAIQPQSITRTYKLSGNVTLEETLVVSPTSPVAMAHYQWTGDIQHLLVSFKSNLRYMWPYDADALGDILYDYSNESSSFVVTDKNREFCSIVASSIKPVSVISGQFDGFMKKGNRWVGVETDKLQAASLMKLDLKGVNSVDFYFVAGNEGVNNAMTEYKRLIQSPQQLIMNSLLEQENFLDNHLTIETPDSLFNKGFKWAMLGTSQFMVETPGLGTSLMAGYSTTARGWNGFHKVSGRPGYAWYFGRDAQWSGMALNAYGDFNGVKQVLQTFIKYQKVDGKIYHELTSSGSVHYDASDATPLFVILAADYLKHSGDLAFIKQNWNVIKKAMDYCYSTDTDGDGLIEISNVGHGWLEGGKLYGSHTEFYLVGCWARALEDAAWMATAINKLPLANQYGNDAKQVLNLINQKFWNPKGFYNFGMYKDGSFTEDFIILTSVPAYFNVLDQSKVKKMVHAYAGHEFSADWGARMISEDSPMFDANSYHFGSVWPLFTGWTALAEYQNSRYNQGFSRIMANLLNYKYFSPGRVVEVMNGATYKPAGVTFHQCWSESMVVQPVVEGMLGFAPDALENTVKLSPRIPFNWGYIKANNLKFSQNTFSFHMKRSEEQLCYEFVADSTFTLKFSPVLPLMTRVSKVLVDGKEVEFILTQKEEYLQLAINDVKIEHQATIKVLCQGGISPIAAYSIPEIGTSSDGYRLLGQKLLGDILEIEVEGLSGRYYSLDLFSKEDIESINGAKLLPPDNKPGSLYSLGFTISHSKSKYNKKIIRIHIKK